MTSDLSSRRSDAAPLNVVCASGVRCVPSAPRVHVRLVREPHAPARTAPAMWRHRPVVAHRRPRRSSKRFPFPRPAQVRRMPSNITRRRSTPPRRERFCPKATTPDLPRAVPDDAARRDRAGAEATCGRVRRVAAGDTFETLSVAQNSTKQKATAAWSTDAIAKPGAPVSEKQNGCPFEQPSLRVLVTEVTSSYAALSFSCRSSSRTSSRACAPAISSAWATAQSWSCLSTGMRLSPSGVSE